MILPALSHSIYRFFPLFVHLLLLQPAGKKKFLAKIPPFSYLIWALCQKITFVLAKSPLLPYNPPSKVHPELKRVCSLVSGWLRRIFSPQIYWGFYLAHTATADSRIE